MQTKILEIRDRGTMIAVIAINMNPVDGGIQHTVQKYYLRRVGFACDGRPNIAIAHLRAGGDPFWNDPYGWGGRTYPVAHDYIINNWEKLEDGDVIDVQFILGETTSKKVSERFDEGRG